MSRRRQPGVDTAAACHYADQPSRRPHCTLTATVELGAVALCESCAARRSSVGKGQSSVALPAGRQVDVLAWIGAAHQDANAANSTLSAAITRARQAGHPWSDIAAQLGVSRQAAQQRFTRASGHASPAQMTDGKDKEATAD